MASIIGAVACSHTPTIGFAHDKNKQDDPVWAPIFQDKGLDHGCFSPLSVLCDHDPAWPFPIIPLQVGVLQAPGHREFPGGHLHVYAAMRGQTLADFQKTRNAPGALYSVSGGGGQAPAWDAEADKPAGR